jgi:hypothetical protein
MPGDNDGDASMLKRLSLELHGATVCVFWILGCRMFGIRARITPLKVSKSMYPTTRAVVVLLGIDD